MQRYVKERFIKLFDINSIIIKVIFDIKSIKIGREYVDILPYEQVLFRVKYIKNDTIEEKYTLPFCILKK